MAVTVPAKALDEKPVVEIHPGSKELQVRFSERTVVLKAESYLAAELTALLGVYQTAVGKAKAKIEGA